MHTKKVLLFIFSALLLFAFFGCQKKEGTSMPTEQNKESVRRLIDEAWNKGNLAIIDELLSPNYRLHIDAPGANDREGYKDAIRTYRTAMPDFHFTIDDLFAEGNKVVLRCTMTGTQQNELMGFPPTGKKLSMTAISIRHFENGKIAEEWVETNMLSVLQQMGAIPSPDQRARK